MGRSLLILSQFSSSTRVGWGCAVLCNSIILAWPFPSCVTLAKSLCLFEPSFSHKQNVSGGSMQVD